MKTKIKRPVKIEHLINWYFGNFCIRCGKINLDTERYGKDCYDKMQKIKSGIEAEEMTHKEFVEIMKRTTFCRPIKREFSRCRICECLGIKKWP